MWIEVGLYSLKMMRDRAVILLRVPRVPHRESDPMHSKTDARIDTWHKKNTNKRERTLHAT